MKKIILLSIIVLFCFMGTASAAITMSSQYPNGTAGSPTIITRSDPINLTMSVNGFNTHPLLNGTTYPIQVYGFISDGGRIFCVSDNQTISQNGTYVFSFPSDQLPFDQHRMYVTYVASMLPYPPEPWNDLDGNGIPWEQEDTDFLSSHYGETGAPGWLACDFNLDGVINYLDLSFWTSRYMGSSPVTNASGYFTINGPADTWTHEISLKDFDPYCFNMQGLHVVNDGFRWSMTTNSTTSEIVYLFVCDGNTRGLIAFGTRSVTYAEMYEWDGSPVGFTWYDYETKRAQGNLSFFKPRYPYYVYIGVKVGGTYTFDNTRLTMLDQTGSGGDFRELNFSIDNYNKDTVLSHNTHTKTNDFQGYYSYFETMPGPGETIAGVGPHTSNYVMAIRIWFASFGMGWMTYLIGFLIVIGFVGPVYTFSRKFNISLPNIVYAAFIMAGVTAAWIIGFFDFWIFLFFVLLAMLSLVIKFREPIEQAVSESITRRSLPKHIISLPERIIRRKKEEGVRAYIEPRGQIPRAGHPQGGPGVYQPNAFAYPIDRGKMTEEDWLRVSHSEHRPVYSESGKKVYYYKKGAKRNGR